MNAAEPTDPTPLQVLRHVLEEQGVVAALRMLNARAPHRFTGIYRYEPTLLRNVHLVDAFDPALEHGNDVDNQDAYCRLLADGRGTLAFGDAVSEAPGSRKWASAVVSYCGVLLVTTSGVPYGSLCHFDVKRCERPASEMPLLERVAPLIMVALEARDVISPAP